MDHLFSLHCSTRLLEVNTELHRINHLLVCETSEEASTLLKQFLTLNQRCGVSGQVTDNIAKISINDVQLLHGSQNEIEQAERLKSLLVAIDELADSQSKRIPELTVGFYYYNNKVNKVLFYRLVEPNKEDQSKHMKNINNIEGTQIMGIFSYLLSYSSNIKQYITVWRQTAFKKQNIKILPTTNNKLDHFMTSLLNKQLPTLKIAMHTLQITIERILWANNCTQETAKHPTNKSKNSNQVRKCLKNQSPRRLKQSNSMISLSSSTNKGRKYKRTSPHFKNEKVFKQTYTKSSSSFWNGKMSNTFGSTVKNTALLGNTKNLSSNWQKESAIMDSFAKINQFNLEKSVINQSELLELLEKKQKIRKVNGFETRESKMMDAQQKSDNPSNFNNTLQIKFVEKPKKQMKLDLGNYEICIQPVKKLPNCKLNSTVYSISEKLCQIISKEEKVSIESKSSRKEIEKNELSTKKIKDKSQQKEVVSQVAGYVTNTLFLYETIQILCNEKTLRRFWLISLYAMYLFYYKEIFVPQASVPEAQINHKTNLVNMASRIEQYKSNPEFNKQMDLKASEDFDCLLSEAKDLDNKQKTYQKQTYLRVLKKQFEKNKSEIVRNKGDFIKNNRFKCFLIYIIRLAICISIMASVSEDNYGVNDFTRYEKIIMEEKQDNQIDLLSELRNCEQFF